MNATLMATHKTHMTECTHLPRRPCYYTQTRKPYPSSFAPKAQLQGTWRHWEQPPTQNSLGHFAEADKDDAGPPPCLATPPEEQDKYKEIQKDGSELNVS